MGCKLGPLEASVLGGNTPLQVVKVKGNMDLEINVC